MYFKKSMGGGAYQFDVVNAFHWDQNKSARLGEGDRIYSLTLHNGVVETVHLKREKWERMEGIREGGIMVIN